MPPAKSKTEIVYIEDIELLIYYTITKAEKPEREPGFSIIYPGAPPYLEISGIYLQDKGADISNLFDYSLSDVEEKLLETLSL